MEKQFKLDYPLELAKTKVAGVDEKFDLSDIEARKRYFEAKAGEEIKKLREYFENGQTFISYWLGKKNSGKGTYSKLMREIFGEEFIGHISVGDIVRSVHADMEDEGKKNELIAYLKDNYRGFMPVEKMIDALLNRDTKTLLPTEFILALLKREIKKMPKKTLFIDGFPREMDQITYTLFFKELIDFRQDPDLFVAIDIPESVIDERMKYRVVCPKCKTPRNTKLFATKEVGFDKEQEKFFLKCDNPECGGERMSGKEGDDLGIESIRERLELDDKLIEKIFSLQGVPKVLLRNSIPMADAKNIVEDYELTPAYSYELDGDKVKTIETPWTITDDEGKEAYSLLAPPVVVSLVKQLAKILF